MQATDNVVMALLSVLGGLGLFLYGIELMGRALRKAAGSALRKGLDFLTRTRFHGLFTGAALTALLQSSSASTVMVVGFISAGLITFKSSIGLILGANIGSTVTTFITAYDFDRLALPFLGIGFIINLIARKTVTRKLGLACMGFGILFLGLNIMKIAVSPYNDIVEGWLAVDGGGLKASILGFLIAMAVTLVIQSSAATIVMIQGLALANISMAIPMIIGANIGTCITALLASLKASKSAKRAALAHVVHNIIGAVITLALFRFYVWLSTSTATDFKVQVFHAHLAIKVVNSLLFLPFTGLYARFITMLMPGKDKLDAAPEFLDYHDVNIPVKALSNVRNEILRMTNVCLEMVEDAVSSLFSGKSAEQELVFRREDLVDDLYSGVADYVMDISKQGLSPALINQPAALMHVMSDVERIGDHAENIVELAQAFVRDNIELSSTAEKEAREMMNLVSEMGENVKLLFNECRNDVLDGILDLGVRIGNYHHDIRKNHESRLVSGECSVMAGIIFVDLTTNLHRVSNHLRSIARVLADHRIVDERSEI